MKRFAGFVASAVLIVSSGTQPAFAADFNVVANFSSSYTINGQTNPLLTVTQGVTYTFDIQAPGHPFWIKTVRSTGTGNAYNGGITNNGIATGTLTWSVPSDAPEDLFYNCEFHAPMTGSIKVVDALPSVTPTPPQVPTGTSTELATATATNTATGTSPPTAPTATATVTTPGQCGGDCDGSGDVAVNELITLVNIALGNLPLSACATADGNQDDRITVDEIVKAVTQALNGCPAG